MIHYDVEIIKIHKFGIFRGIATYYSYRGLTLDELYKFLKMYEGQNKNFDIKFNIRGAM